MKCENCNNEHDGKYASGRFCCSKCAFSFSTKSKRQQINNAVSAKLSYGPKICLECNASASQLHGGSGKFCKDHKRVYSFEQASQATKKRRLIKERGRKCEDCKLELWKCHPIPIQMHHKNGNPKDDRRENLSLLCPNCHTFTDTFCGKNTKNKDKPVISRVRYK